MLIAHLSDPHLTRGGTLYQGLVDSNAMFDLALKHLAELDPTPDLVLITGDLVDGGTPQEYARARASLAAIGQPLLILPGNHDEREAFRAAFDDHAHLPRSGPLHFVSREHGPVRTIATDVTVPGRHHGEITEETAAWLLSELAQEPDRPTLVMMHQPPFPIGIDCIDAYRCRNGERLGSLLDGFSSVERVLCGHVHRFAQARFGGTIALTCPSTTTAIALRLAPDARPASFVEPPAFLLHEWRKGVGMVTHHVPIGRFPGPLPFF